MAGIVGNADTWTVTFVGGNGDAADPDGDVTWVVTDLLTGTETTTMQAVAEKVSTGTYELKYTPTTTHPYSVKASATVTGDAQATEATEREVSA